MYFQIARTSGPTGNLLKRLVEERLEGRTEAVVCYGAGYHGNLPALNKNCSVGNKLTQARALFESNNHQAIKPLLYEDALRVVPAFPVLARNVQHTKGRDIRLCLEPWQVRALRGISDFFVPYEHSEREFRVWAFRKKHLATYEKQLVRPAQFTRIGRNYANGFAFNHIDRHEVPDALKETARWALRTLNLDFGAVDILQCGNDYKVLEVNSAPGVADDRRLVINKLARHIADWANKGCRNAA
jgi:hypothetical protein